MKTKKEGNFEIELWYERYRRDFLPVSKKIDDWYQAYRKDFMPNASGRIEGLSKPVERRVKTRIRNFVLAGSGQVTNEKCGRVSGLYGCLQHEKHEGKGAYVVKLINSCGKPLCPICSKYGWAVRAASLIEDRLSTAIEQKNMGVVEHLVCSAPMDKYDLTYKEFKHKAREILLSIGVNAGVMIFHGIRHKDNPENPNMHVLGFVSGDYDRCRRCKGGDCYACDGARASRANLRSILGSQI